MLEQLRRTRRLRIKEKIIQSSGLFLEDHYRLQLPSHLQNTKNSIRHYLLRGERMGLSPHPLFDQKWYVQEYPDVASSVQDLFFHYVEHGEREGRSPHPLFDPLYYRSQTGERIERPLAHFMARSGHRKLDPHPLFRIDRFLEEYGSVIGDENPLVYFLSHEECEAVFADIFQGTYYAEGLDEVYSWPRHGLAQFVMRTRQEAVSPHPNFDIESYTKSSRDFRSLGRDGFTRFFNKAKRLVAQSHDETYLRGEKLDRPFEGTYDVMMAPSPAGGTRLPAALTALPPQATASSIPARYAEIQRDLNGRFRLDRATPALASNADGPVISILMPVYRPPLIFLDRAIRSVLMQSVGNWELCIVDDCSSDDALTALLHGYAMSDARIKVGTASQNGGIARASNAALALATGAYVGLLDNDDLLTVDAVETVTQALAEEPELDFLYSDECLIDENDLTVRLFSKPDWSPTFLFACMYSSHFTVYRRTLVEQVGRFRPDYDFSQDYDLALRIADTNPRVRHLSAYLYGWRMIPGSAAQGGKPYARLTNVAALQDALDRRGYPGTAFGFPTTNVITRKPTTEQPKVSIIIPSDNLDNISVSVKSIVDHTEYSNLEILVVTNSRIVAEIGQHEITPFVTCVPYDRPFNFSDKCNVGADAATGQYLVLYNDDVRVISSNWVHSLLDIAVLDHVGSVAPKLLYEDGLIQHAGMVTGVRRLVGTAFHTYPSETADHFGMAQYPREVSLLCGACIMVRADVYRRIGGFDAQNAPISHSDVDLCFRIRELGLACVYVPTASLKHIGHVSIGEVEAKPRAFKRDKADIFLLKRWAREVAYDPYFPPAMRDILYRDSQEAFQLHPGMRLPGGRWTEGGRDVLIVSHDLTNSGAPKIVLDIARMLSANGDYVCVVSPTDGPMRERLTAIGIDVIVDELVLAQNQAVFDFTKNFDLAITNTIVTWPFVTQMGGTLPVHWYVHESELVDHFVNVFPEFLGSFPQAARVWVGSSKSGRHLANHGVVDFTVVPYGVDELAGHSAGRVIDADRPMSVGLFGSVEPRKGQDLAVLGILAVPEAERCHIELRLFGRILDKVFADAVKAIANDDPSIVFGGELTPDAYTAAFAEVDVVIVPSRDDTLPLVSLDALAAGKPLVVSRTTGTSEWLEHERSGLLLTHNSPDEIGEVLRRLSTDRELRIAVGAAGRACFEQNFSWNSFVTRILGLLADPGANRTSLTASVTQDAK